MRLLAPCAAREQTGIDGLPDGPDRHEDDSLLFWPWWEWAASIFALYSLSVYPDN
jgi:hypothetical protein